MSKHHHQSSSPSAFATPQQHVASPAGAAVITGPTHDAIAQRAYDIYVKTGRKQGQCKQNWQQAEKSLHDQGHAACQTQPCGHGVSEPHAVAAR